jgi:para-aminobenzoate synthetase/4-amino-4-deoxychorismate lyase
MVADAGGVRLIAALRDAASGRWRLFERPQSIVSARTIQEVVPALRAVESACRERGRHAAGFISYEAAPAFDSAFETKPAEDFPLLWFGIYDEPEERLLEEFATADLPPAGRPWEPSISTSRYLEIIDELQELIRSGETYQVNFTYRLRSRFDSPLRFWPAFWRLAADQQPPFGAYLDTGEWIVCCASPELFFQRNGSIIESRPMKGTAARGLWFEQDVDQAKRLRASEKERAENVMIVDMVRNDLGRIARPGSVRVTRLFDVERYPTVLQMTSTVSAESDASLGDVMSALFPAASISGAPKSATLRIIREVECSPRRIYTGTIGFIEPSGRAQFNVAIRTILVNAATGEAEYGIGGGIVADSKGCQELAESRLKSKVLERSGPEFDLLETLLWRPGEGYLLLEYHLKRLRQSAEYFGFSLDPRAVETQLRGLAAGLEPIPQRIRMLVSRRGAVRLTATAQDPSEKFPALMLAAQPIDQEDPFLYHKTTNRIAYQRALAGRPGFADVLLFNENDEITETTIANVVVEIDGELFTPPLECGLLPGTFRAWLLDQGKVRERRISLEDVMASGRLYLANSVRGMHLTDFVLAPTVM